MAAPTNYWKVGLFVVAGFVLALCAVVYLGVANLRRDNVVYHTYIDEPVQGLDVGASILFRGVKIGQVADIGIAPDRRHVHITCALFTRNLHELGLAEGDGDDTHIAVPPDLRVQLSMVGLTGLKELQLDFVNPRANPAPALPFPVPKNYIPASSSMLSKLGDSMSGAAESVPQIADALVAMSARADRVFAQLEAAKLPETTQAMLARADAAFASLQRGVDEANLPGMAVEARKSLAKFDSALARVDAILARLDGDNGVIASVHRTSNAIGDVAATSPALGEELASTLREIQEAAASFRRLTDALERNPEMLLKGRKDRQ